MKRAVSVSLGSKAGDFERKAEFAGVPIHLSREGMDGDMERAKERISFWDGRADAIGLGGIDIYLAVGTKQFVIGDGQRLAEAAAQTPVVDGSGLKNTLERTVVHSLASQGLVTPHSRILMVSALDRFGMAETFVQNGCACVFGDLIFNIGLDYPMTQLSEIEELAEKYRSRLLNVPFHRLYPTGSAQDAAQADSRYAKYYQEADIIAGDAHLILRHLPEKLLGKGVVTNTTRPHTLRRFQEAGIRWIVTTTPEMEGVSGGTNLMEAALVALMGKAPVDITPQDYAEWSERLGWHGSVHYFEETRTQ